jgi:hypothetical protein
LWVARKGDLWADRTVKWTDAMRADRSVVQSEGLWADWKVHNLVEKWAVAMVHLKAAALEIWWAA